MYALSYDLDSIASTRHITSKGTFCSAGTRNLLPFHRKKELPAILLDNRVYEMASAAQSPADFDLNLV